MSVARLPTLVVGGGIGGLATALSVARNGRPVHVIEQAAEFTEVGAGLQFGPNASRALDALGILNEILPLAVKPERAVMDAVSGQRLAALRLGEPMRWRYGYHYLLLHRSDLLDLLLKHCRAHELVTLENRRRVTDAEVRPDGATVACADGSVYETEALVAADGLHSRLRREVVDDAATCSGYAAYRGAIPMSGFTHAVSHEDVVLWVGPGVHLVQYALRGRDLNNQVAVFRSPCFQAGHTAPDQWGGPDELDAAFAGAARPVRDAVSVVGRGRHWPMYERNPAPTWIRHRLVLTGDAAHPMLQYLGQGACQALEDAVELGYRFGCGGSDVDTAFRGFEAARLARTARCQAAARLWGELWHATDPVTVAVRNRYFALRADDDYTELDWLYAAAEPGTAAPGLTASAVRRVPAATAGSHPRACNRGELPSRATRVGERA